MAHDGSIIIDVDVLTKQAEEHLERLRAIGESSGDDISERMKYNANKIADEWESAGVRYKQVVEDMKAVASEIENMKFNIDVEMKKPQAQQDIEGLTSMRADLSKAEVEYSKLNKEAKKLTKNMDYSSVKANELYQNVNKTDDSMKKVSQSSLNVGKSMKSSFKSLTKYAMALFGVRSIYQGLKTLANEWMNSDDIAAQQMKANMEGIKNILVNAIAPVVQFVGDLIMNIVGYISAFLKLFFGVNLAAKKAGKTVKKGVGGSMSQAKDDAKELQTILAGFDKAEVVSIQKETGSGGGGGGSGGGFDMAPTFDTSPFEKAINKLKKDLKPFIDMINSIDFTPMKKNFEKVVKSMQALLKVLYGSFVRTMNNAIGPFIKILSEEIIPRALLSVSKAIDMITPHIDWLLQNFIEPFIEWFLLEYWPAWADVLLSVFDLLIAVLDKFLDGVRVGIEIIKPFVQILGTLLVMALNVVAKALQWVTEELQKEDSALGELIKVIGVIVTAYLGFKTVMGVVGNVVTIFTNLLGVLKGAFTFVLTIAKAVSTFFAGALTGSIGAIIAIIAILVTSIVGIATNFDQVKQDIGRIIGNIKGLFQGLWQFISGVFTGNWSRAWQGVVNVFRNIVGGIANIFKLPINTMISGINAFIRGINRIKIPSWVPGVGGAGFNIGQIPHLAKGGVLRQPTLNVAGEYAGAKRNPEIVTPQDIMLDTVRQALAEQGNSGNGDITVTIPLIVDGRVLTEVTEKISKKDYMQGNGRLRTA